VRNWGYAIAQCGHYGDPPSLKVYTPQMVEWVLCVIVGRLACGLMVYSTAGVLGFVARYIDAMFHSLSQNNAEANSAELWAVMVAGPLTMNMIQVWPLSNPTLPNSMMYVSNVVKRCLNTNYHHFAAATAPPPPPLLLLRHEIPCGN
jgi:hypothetical protein